MKRKVFSLAIILTFILSLTLIFVACDNNEGPQYPINVSMTFSMDGVDYTYELNDTGETQTFNIKYGENTVSYDVIKIGDHYYVCGGVAEFTIEDGALKIYSIGNAIDFIIPRSYHAGTHTIDGKTVTLQEDGTFVSPDGNAKYYVVDGNKLVVPDGNGSGIVYSKTVGEYVKVGTFYGDSVAYPDGTWSDYSYDGFIADTQKTLSIGENYGRLTIIDSEGDYTWYYGRKTLEGDYVVLSNTASAKKFSIDSQNNKFDEAHVKLAKDGKELRLYNDGKAILKGEMEGIIYQGEQVDFNDGKYTVKVLVEENYVYYVYDNDLPEIFVISGEYKGLPAGAKSAKIKGDESVVYYFLNIDNKDIAYMPVAGGYQVCECEVSSSDGRIYTIYQGGDQYNVFVEGEYLYANSDVSASIISEKKAELSNATNVTTYNWVIDDEIKPDMAGTVEFTTYTINDENKCVLFIYNLFPNTELGGSLVITNVLECGSYTVTIDGDVTEYSVTAPDNYVYVFRVQNNEIIYADYTW